MHFIVYVYSVSHFRMIFVRGLFNLFNFICLCICRIFNFAITRKDYKLFINMSYKVGNMILKFPCESSYKQHIKMEFNARSFTVLKISSTFLNFFLLTFFFLLLYNVLIFCFCFYY